VGEHVAYTLDFLGTVIAVCGGVAPFDFIGAVADKAVDFVLLWAVADEVIELLGWLVVLEPAQAGFDAFFHDGAGGAVDDAKRLMGRLHLTDFLANTAGQLEHPLMVMLRLLEVSEALLYSLTALVVVFVDDGVNHLGDVVAILGKASPWPLTRLAGTFQRVMQVFSQNR